MKLTIAIPTHNRAATLAQTLASLQRLRLPADLKTETLVIDNASTDNTQSAVRECARLLPILARCVREERLGSSFARNRAVDETGADFIFFIDDDVIVEPDWAIELLAELERGGLDAACGMVLPRWPQEPPAWLGARLWVKLAVHDSAGWAAAGGWNKLTNYFSANLGMRRTTFERFGRFREDLGVVGGNPISGEDTELFARILARGGKMGFAPRAVVHHLIGPERLRRAYFRKKSFAYGVGSAFTGGRSHNHLDKLVRNAWRMMLAQARGDSTTAFYHQLECVNFFGYWRGRVILARRPAARGT